MYKSLGLLLIVIFANCAQALQQNDVVGTWKLVSGEKKIVKTGEIVNAYGAHPVGWITYSRDGRMMTVAAFDGRPKLPSIDKIKDSDKIKLFDTLFAYAGTYTISGNQIIHHVDTSWNETWTGTDKVRNVEVRGNQLVYTTTPQMSPSGQMVVLTLVWQKWP